MATLTSASLQRIARDIEQLKPLPTNVLRVVRALNDPDVSASTVADLVSLDQALTANILRLANSVSSASGRLSSAPARRRLSARIWPATK